MKKATQSIFQRYARDMTHLAPGEMLPFRKKVSMPQHSPTRVADFDSFNDTVMYERLRSDHVFKLIENLEWNNATAQLKRNKHIAKQWVINAGTRMLPLHEACVHQPTEEMIYILLSLYPDGAREQDSNGRYPIHHACVHRASADVICLLLDAFPESADAKDNWGKTSKVYALDAGTPDVDVIQALFHKNHVSRVNKDLTAASNGYGYYYDTDKPSQLVPYNNKTGPMKSQVESMATYHVKGLDSTHDQMNTSCSRYNEIDVTGQKEKKDRSRINYLDSVRSANKNADRIAMSTTHIRIGRDEDLARRANRARSTNESDPRRDATLSQIEQFQPSRSGGSHSMVPVESRRHHNFSNVARLQNGADELKSQAEEINHLKIELLRAVEQNSLAHLERDDALEEIAQIDNKMSKLEAELLSSRETKGIIMKKDAENDLLRNINKDLRARSKNGADELKSQAEEINHLKIELLRAVEQNSIAHLERDDALEKVAQIDNKMSKLEAELLGMREAKGIVKYAENEIEDTIISISRRFDNAKLGR